jgi:hypothetical protein
MKKTQFDDKVTVIDNAIDTDFLTELSDGYSSLEDSYRRNGIGLGPRGMANIDKIKNVTPSAEYQKRLIANTNANPNSQFYKREYPDMPKTMSAENISRDQTRDIVYVDRTNNINAGIPPIQMNQNIKEANLDSVKMNDFKVSQPVPILPQQSPMLKNNADKSVPTQGHRYRSLDRYSCSCVDVMNHNRMCPVCQRYQNYEKNMYMVIIIMILVISSIIIFFLMKENKNLKNLLKK